LKRAATRGGEITRGLARVRNPEGLILAYATQYMATAADGPADQDSPFTAALLDNIATPGLDVKDLFFRVGRDVIARTKGEQRPEISVSFYDPYALVGGSGSHAVYASTSSSEAVVASPKPVLEMPSRVVAPAPRLIFPDSDRRRLTVEEVQRLPKPMLRIARNEIFARKGWIFQDASLREYFSQFTWYRPITRDVTLSVVEEANVGLIKRMER